MDGYLFHELTSPRGLSMMMKTSREHNTVRWAFVSSHVQYPGQSEPLKLWRSPGRIFMNEIVLIAIKGTSCIYSNYNAEEKVFM